MKISSICLSVPRHQLLATRHSVAGAFRLHISYFPLPALSSFILLTFSFLLHAAPPKEALLIANGKYSHFAGLAHPSPDAAKLSAALEQLGFRVRVVRDGNREQMIDAIAEFERGLRNTGAIAFFHYGGHGVQVDGKNYLLPADADIPDERRVATRAVALDEVMTAMDAASARASIIVIDACRDNPLPAGSGRNLARGLSVVGMKPKNSIVIYAAEAGSKALDGLFTPILASSLQQKGRSINQIMMSVRSEVYAKSSGQQTPGEYNQLFEELILSYDLSDNAKIEKEIPAIKVYNFVCDENKLLALSKINIEKLKEKAFDGDADAKYILACRYGSGIGIGTDIPKAIEWLSKAAEKGHASAQSRLGFCYDIGEGVEKNHALALEWYRKAAEQGDPNAQFRLGDFYLKGQGVEKNSSLAASWFQKSAEQGNSMAQFSIGHCFAFGDGVKKDATKAVEWYRKAAEQGELLAQFSLGYCYSEGDGVARDSSISLKWYSTAAYNGHSPSQYILGSRFANGEGVPKDAIEAYALLNLAAVSTKEALKARSQLEKSMSKEQISAGQIRSKEIQAEIKKSMLNKGARI
jgi:TPR repeat protein